MRLSKSTGRRSSAISLVPRSSFSAGTLSYVHHGKLRLGGMLKRFVFLHRQGTFATVVACTIDGNNLRSRRVMLMRGSAEFIAVRY